MNVLIGDIGNTKTKICIFNIKKQKIVNIYNLNTNKVISAAYLKNFFHKKKLFKKKFLKKVLFASVVPKKLNIFKFFFKKKFHCQLVEIKDKNIKHCITINIKNPKQVGSDRIANTSGVFKVYKKNSIVVDFGTATTFDVIKKNGIYDGGLIAPGIELSIHNLYKSTAMLPYIEINKSKKIIGKNTSEAMKSGFYWGYLGLVKNIINEINVNTKKRYSLIFTGGLAHIFAKAVSKNTIVDKNLTIKGIIEIYKINSRFFNN